jgi:hypothetical protein
VKDTALSSQLQRSETDVAYAPQLGEALHITHTQLNVIGEFASDFVQAYFHIYTGLAGNSAFIARQCPFASEYSPQWAFILPLHSSGGS